MFQPWPKKLTQKQHQSKKLLKLLKPQTEETTQETAVEEAPSANNAEDFLADFNWHHYEEGIDVIEDKQLEEFEALVRENFVDTADDDVIEGVVVYMTDREP